MSNDMPEKIELIKLVGDIYNLDQVNSVIKAMQDSFLGIARIAPNTKQMGRAQLESIVEAADVLVGVVEDHMKGGSSDNVLLAIAAYREAKQ